MYVSPAACVTDSLRRALLGMNHCDSLPDLAVVTAFAAVLIGAGTCVFKHMRL